MLLVIIIIIIISYFPCTCSVEWLLNLMFSWSLCRLIRLWTDCMQSRSPTNSYVSTSNESRSASWRRTLPSWRLLLDTNEHRVHRAKRLQPATTDLMSAFNHCSTALEQLVMFLCRQCHINTNVPASLTDAISGSCLLFHVAHYSASAICDSYGLTCVNTIIS